MLQLYTSVAFFGRKLDNRLDTVFCGDEFSLIQTCNVKVMRLFNACRII